MPVEKQAILQRLRTAEGHLRAVGQMLEDDRPYPQVLYQLDAVQCAIQAAGAEIIRSEIECCLQFIQDNPDPDQRCAELLRLSDLYPFYYKTYSRISKDCTEVK